MNRKGPRRAWIKPDRSRIKRCPECGVPEEITANYLWLNSGVIVQKSNPSRRISFMESDNLDPLYEGIGRIVGYPIDDLIISIVRQGTADYFKNIITPELKEMLLSKVLGLNFIADLFITSGQLNGNGGYELVDIRFEGDDGDYTIVRISEPFSVLLAAGINAGASEIITGKAHDVTYEQISPGLYEVKVFVSKRTQEPEAIIAPKEYRHRNGNIDLARCAACGGPAALRDFKWHVNRGVIVNNLTGRRMVLIGLEVQDYLFEELQREVGEIIPRAVVEAQRNFAKTGFHSIHDIDDEEAFRTQLALRGMGELKELKMDAGGLRMRIDNAANYLMTVGQVQGLFEMAFDTDSSVEWEMSEEGDLKVEVKRE
jgi:ribosomal protein L37E